MNARMRRSREQEARGAKQHGGRVQPGSGSGRYQQGDVKSPFELIEYKRTDNKTIRIDSTDIAILRGKALTASRDPLFGIEVGGRDYVVVDQFDLEWLVERRAQELARDIVQRRLGDAGLTQSEIQSATEVCGESEQRERPVLPRAASLPEGRDRGANDAAVDGGDRQGLLSRPEVRRGPRLPRADRMPGVVNGELAAVWHLGGSQRARASQVKGIQGSMGRTSRVIGKRPEGPAK